MSAPSDEVPRGRGDDAVRRGRRAKRRNRLALAAAVVAVVVLAVAYVLTTTNDSPGGLEPVGDSPFDAAGAITPGPYRAAFSADGARLAVLGGSGVFLAEGGRLRRMVSASNAVDFAWLGRSGVLIAEGPIPTGQLAAVGMDGRGLGTARLDLPIGVGTGHGMSVSPDRRSAVLTAVDRAPIGGREQTRLVTVELESGKVTPVAGTDAATRPFFVDNATVFFTRPGGTAMLDLRDGRVRAIGRGISAGVIDGTWLVSVVGRDVRAVLATGGAAQRLARLPEGTSLVAVDPGGRRGVRAERRAGSAEVQLVEQRLRALVSTNEEGPLR